MGYSLFTSIFFLIIPFLSRLYELYRSLEDLEILDEFNLLQNLHLSAPNLFVQQAPNLLEKLADSLLYNSHHEHILLKLKKKP